VGNSSISVQLDAPEAADEGGGGPASAVEGSGELTARAQKKKVIRSASVQEDEALPGAEAPPPEARRGKAGVARRPWWSLSLYLTFVQYTPGELEGAGSHGNFRPTLSTEKQECPGSECTAATGPRNSTLRSVDLGHVLD
jgi:hypothetical protein